MTAIEWTHFPGTRGETWDPTIGCSKVSRGCRNCYAIRDVWRLAHNPHAAVAARHAGLVEKRGGKLTWTGKVVVDVASLGDPLRHRDPRTYFVDSRSDLFHAGLTEPQIDRVFDVIDAAPRHRFIVLTKRPDRMAAYMAAAPVPPPRNLALGVSVEDMDAIARLDVLRETPAALRIVSLEPLVGPVTLRPYLKALDWVIAGGESKGGDPVDPQWIADLAAQCRAARVPFFFKQWGDWAPPSAIPLRTLADLDLARLPARRMPSGAWVYRFGKARAGAQFMTREIKEFPAWPIAAARTAFADDKSPGDQTTKET